MRIVHIGHGRIEIPPKASGAVEAIIADHQFWCEKLGHEFLVVNEKHPEHSMVLATQFFPDVVHLHDESKMDHLSGLDSHSLKIVTTHDPTFFEKPNPFIKRFVEGDFLVGCLCQRYVDLFVKAGVAPERILLTPNGARGDLIQCEPECIYPSTMICLGSIGKRKRQDLLFRVGSGGIYWLRCAGPVSTHDPIETGGGRFLQEWSKSEVYEQLTDYAALVLISASEAAPLVVVEALMAGLDVVVSEVAAANLDRSQPFIHVLDERTICNPLLLEMALKKVLNRPKDRMAVRAYAEANFDWGVLVKRYLAELWKRLRHGYERVA
jgi:glycosyltransferase involved in cell wall biosynthesis